MIQLKVVKSLMICGGFILFSCNSVDVSGLETAINDMKDKQEVVLKKIGSLEKAMNNLALANKNQPSNKKNAPPKADPNKVYNVPIGDSFVKGPKNAPITITEWTDFQ